MKKRLNDLIIILMLVVLAGISYIYIPLQAKALDEKISQSTSLNLAQEYDAYLSKNLPRDIPKLYFYWFSHQKKISDLRIKRAIEEVKNTQVGTGKMQIWSFLNMGAVIKTSNKTIAIDTANLPFSSAHNALVDLADIFIVSHIDADHFDATLLNKALEKNKKVVFLEEFIFEAVKPDGVIKLKSGESKEINGVKVTAYQTDHRGDGNFKEPCAWIMVEVDGYKLLHTGDGRDFKNKEEQNKVYATKDFDVLLGNIALHPYNIRDLKPRVWLPLHLFKFMHGQELYRESTFEAVQNNNQKYEKDLQGIEIVYLLPGESLVYPTE